MKKEWEEALTKISGLVSRYKSPGNGKVQWKLLFADYPELKTAMGIVDNDDDVTIGRFYARYNWWRRRNERGASDKVLGKKFKAYKAVAQPESAPREIELKQPEPIGRTITLSGVCTITLEVGITMKWTPAGNGIHINLVRE